MLELNNVYQIDVRPLKSCPKEQVTHTYHKGAQ